METQFEFGSFRLTKKLVKSNVKTGYKTMTPPSIRDNEDINN